MFWLRLLLFALPLLFVFGATWLFSRVGDLQLARESGALVSGIREPIGLLNPLAPADGITGEVSDLVFEPLLRRDGEGRLVPGLLDRWTSRTVVTIRCSSEEAAGESEALLRSGEALGEGLVLLAIERVEAVLTVALEGSQPDLEARLLAGLPEENLGNDQFVRLRMSHSARASLEAFLANSVERSQLRMMEFAGDGEAHLFVRGEADRFLDELRAYYASNPSLGAVVEEEGPRSHTSLREMVLELRDDVTWHDGTDFTSADVVFSYGELTRPGSPLPLDGAFAFLDSLEAVGRHRLRVVCREMPATMLESWERLPLLPAHRLGPSGGLANAEALLDFFARPVGLGPYRVGRRLPDGGIELVANESYFRGSPLEKVLRYRRFDSLEAKLLALRYGYLDAMVPDERFSAWSERHLGTVETRRDQASAQHFVAWNLDRAPLDDGAVRSALAKAVDLDAILRETATDFQVPVTSLFHPSHPAVTGRMPLPRHDPREAERLLEGAGYRLDESTGRRSGAGGRELAFILLVNESSAEHRRLAAALAEQWAAVGCEVKIETVPWTKMVTERIPARDYDAVFLSWKLPRGRDLGEVWHSSAAESGGGNPSGLRDVEVDRLLSTIRRETDPDRVSKAIESLHETIARLQPCFFVCDSGRILTLRTDALRLARPSADGAYLVEPITIGTGGLSESRPWWVRRETLEARNLSD